MGRSPVARGPAVPGPGPTSCRSSSCRPRSSSCPCGYARWSACADRAPEGHGGAGCPGSNRSRSCGGCRPGPHGGGHPRSCSSRRSSHGADELVVAQLVDPAVTADAGFLQGLQRTGAADAEDVGESDLKALVAREVDANEACHRRAVPFCFAEVLRPASLSPARVRPRPPTGGRSRSASRDVSGGPRGRPRVGRVRYRER